jgi:aspartate dehydrogenase
VLKIGLIGFGTIGRDVAQGIAEGKAGNAELKAVLVRRLSSVDQELGSGVLVTDNEADFLGVDVDLVVEAAGHGAVQAHGVNVLQSGRDLIVVSVGAFCDQSLYDAVWAAAEKAQRRVIVPSAAVAGLDRIAAGAQGRLDSVTLTTRKPVAAWRGTFAEEVVNLDTLTEATEVFKGTAREASRTFPESVNVSAALSLAGVGLDETIVRVMVDPDLDRNTHQIEAVGQFGKVSIQVENTASKENPKTGYIVAMSVLKVIKGNASPLVIGI